MKRLGWGVLVLSAGAIWGCTTEVSPGPALPAATVSTVAPAATAGPAKTAEPSALPPIAYVEDNIEAAAARAKAEGKALFVDVWAPWCHTCLSMKSYVLGEPALRPLASRVVFAAIDSDRESSAKFLQSHQVKVWPTFFVIDPANDSIAGAWLGSASLGEMRAFIDDSLATIDASRAGKLPPDDPVRLIAEARAAQTADRPRDAAALFERAFAKLAPDHPRRSEVLSGWLFALYTAKAPAACAEMGLRHLNDVRGAAMPADFASMLLGCIDGLPDAEKAQARSTVIARLRAITAAPPAEASADDRADAWGILAEALADSGDSDGAKEAQQKKLAILEKAAASAPAPEVAATYDYARAGTYVALGKGEQAVAMLTAREKEMPASYEPPARLASTLFKLGRYDEAKAAVDRAIAKAYGPRRLGYLKLRASILAKLGDLTSAVTTLRDEVRGWEAMPQGQASPAALEDARKRLAQAEAATSGKPPK